MYAAVVQVARVGLFVKVLCTTSRYTGDLNIKVNKLASIACRSTIFIFRAPCRHNT